MLGPQMYFFFLLLYALQLIFQKGHVRNCNCCKDHSNMLASNVLQMITSSILCGGAKSCYLCLLGQQKHDLFGKDDAIEFQVNKIPNCVRACFRKSSWSSVNPRSPLPSGPLGKLSAPEQQGRHDWSHKPHVEVEGALTGMKRNECGLSAWAGILWISFDLSAGVIPSRSILSFSEDEAKQGARRLARCLQKIGFKVGIGTIDIGPFSTSVSCSPLTKEKKPRLNPHFKKWQ